MPFLTMAAISETLFPVAMARMKAVFLPSKNLVGFTLKASDSSRSKTFSKSHGEP